MQLLLLEDVFVLWATNWLKDCIEICTYCYCYSILVYNVTIGKNINMIQQYDTIKWQNNSIRS